MEKVQVEVGRRLEAAGGRLAVVVSIRELEHVAVVRRLELAGGRQGRELAGGRLERELGPGQDGTQELVESS